MTMEIQHYSAINSKEDIEELSFAISTGYELPCQFNLCENGVFAAHSQFGAIERREMLHMFSTKHIYVRSLHRILTF